MGRTQRGLDVSDLRETRGMCLLSVVLPELLTRYVKSTVKSQKYECTRTVTSQLFDNVPKRTQPPSCTVPVLSDLEMSLDWAD